jgi:hypothetical protein
VRPFDPKSYLAEVLGPYQGSTETPSLFERYLLDLDDADDAAIERRLEEVKRYWDKQTEHPRYGSMIRGLTDKHPEARLTLADARERSRIVKEERGKQEENAERRRREREGWERLLRQSVESSGGLDPARRAQLEKVGRRAGIPEGELRQKLDAVPEVKEPEVLDAAIRSSIASNLSALAQTLEEPRRGLSLFHALELEVTAEPDEVRAQRQAEVLENNKRAEGNAKNAWDRVLSQAKLYLLDGDPGAYVNGLVADVREALEQPAFEAIADDNVIDELEAEQLRQRAVELGLSPALAQRVIAELAREQGAVVRTGEEIDLVVCPACNHPHQRSGAGERCSRCGSALFIACPSCEERMEATAARCSNCGTDLHRHAAASRAMERLPDLLDDGRVAQAQAEMERAMSVLGSRNPEAAEIGRRVKAAVEKTRRNWAEVEAARADRRQYEARRLLVELAKGAGDFRSDAGELPAEAQASVEARIDEAEQRLRAALQAGAGRRENALVEVLRIAADCSEAERELDKLPPEPPGAVKVAAAGGALSVGWSPSVTAGVSYAVTRVALPAGIESRVGETEGRQLDDSGAPPGAVVRYRVTAIRGRVQSSAVSSEPVVAAYEVRGLSATAGDGQVDLSWGPVGDGGRVVVERREEGSPAPVSIVPGLTGASDRQVENGRRYEYRVCTEYPSPDGGVIRTAGQTVFAQPVERPRPLQDLRVRVGRDRVELDFEPPPVGSVAVFRASQEPDLAAGESVDPSRLASLGERLAIQGTTAIDDQPPTGRCFYLPVTTAGSIAVAGEVVHHVALPQIENTHVVQQGKKALVTWTWPPGVTIARVAWRHDRRPAGPDDPAAEQLDYRHGEYRDHGGFSLAMGTQRSLFVAVYPATRADGEVVCGQAGGKGSTAMLRAEQKTEVRYSVRRVGGLRKRLEVEVSEPADGALPELVLVGREGDILPRSAADGKVLARLGGDGPRSSSLEVRQLSRPLAIKLFLDSAAAAGSHVLFDPMVDDLLIG